MNSNIKKKNVINIKLFEIVKIKHSYNIGTLIKLTVCIRNTYRQCCAIQRCTALLLHTEQRRVFIFYLIRSPTMIFTFIHSNDRKMYENFHFTWCELIKTLVQFARFIHLNTNLLCSTKLIQVESVLIKLYLCELF